MIQENCLKTGQWSCQAVVSAQVLLYYSCKIVIVKIF